ncbi:TetR/AcrR family transcriptional regulator [Actinomadura craniellae]|uniref:TetR/AcrR family transcriptional regulator n=1 Tax=Actinomadura craniellae TaxID=2231787 RepID=A0A365H7L3_9ACTN|nr:TetR/AcrR family transcriptional regulator [Actinomadura craniellae]RAY15095.1 TetR/AcrR family transcriptional regulator [Actinomadura craniellae]
MINVQGGSLDLADGQADVGPGGPPRTPAGRPERREQTRTALLAAARRLWAERGIHGASLDDVAAAAGLTKGAVYSNFSGKTDLLLALLEQRIQAMVGVEAEIYGALHADGTPPQERLEQAGEAYSRHLGSDEARLLSLLMGELWLYGMRHRAPGRRLADWYEGRRDGLAEGLEEVDGLLPEERATLALAVDLGLALQHLLDPERVPADLYSAGLRLILGPAMR